MADITLKPVKWKPEPWQEPELHELTPRGSGDFRVWMQLDIAPVVPSGVLIVREPATVLHAEAVICPLYDLIEHAISLCSKFGVNEVRIDASRSRYEPVRAMFRNRGVFVRRLQLSL